ncbi:hypothetical protein LTR37_000378 [Vermiconidia calcicola]|uniref:Uncharacterized protein n=1 Tax=Vermiconidia calcicola TaxID=1690605 RepID=A0ACC3NYT7_9PEZI|nr:hypothetical protein LTR37_000378 [Vermiconidia calcicola]
MANLFSFLNRLLPFATPGTPLLQDLLHLGVICTLLYFAPQIQECLLPRPHGDQHPVPAEDHVANVEPDQLREAEREQERHRDPDLNDANIADDHDRQENVHYQQEDQPGPIPEGQPGPARAPDTTAPRNVGAKKAKSLARRDQKRAYNEFMRSQGEAQRARDAEGAAEREAALAAEKERRRAAAVALEAKKAKEREQRREREEAERREEIRRRELAVSIVRQELQDSNMCDLFKVARQLGDDIDEEWVEQILRASGLIGRKGDIMTTITGMGWVVSVTADDMAQLYRTATDRRLGDDYGRVDYNDLGALLETSIRG